MTARRPAEPSGDVHVATSGPVDGPATLVVHGGGGPASVAGLAAHLAAGGRRVLLPTHPGWENTPRDPAVSTVPELAARYVRLLADHGLRGVSVVASSFGGWIAAEIAGKHHPDPSPRSRCSIPPASPLPPANSPRPRRAPLTNCAGADPGTDVRMAVRRTLSAAVAAGTLQIMIEARYALDDAAEAHRRLMSGHGHGKLVLLP